MQILYEHIFSVLLGIFLRVEFLGHTVASSVFNILKGHFLFEEHLKLKKNFNLRKTMSSVGGGVRTVRTGQTAGREGHL